MTKMADRITIRQEIRNLLIDNLLTAKDISKIIRIKEKDVIDHLNHIAKSVGKKDFIIEPSVCMKCGFVFYKRERLTSPRPLPCLQTRRHIRAEIRDKKGRLTLSVFSEKGLTPLSKDIDTIKFDKHAKM